MSYLLDIFPPHFSGVFTLEDVCCRTLKVRQHFFKFIHDNIHLALCFWRPIRDIPPTKPCSTWPSSVDMNIIRAQNTIALLKGVRTEILEMK
jgi:hypothetical protein